MGIESPAFRRAVLKSEKLRIFFLLVIVGLLLAFGIVRDLMMDEGRSFRLLTYPRVVPLVLVFYELLMLDLVNRALRTRRELPDWLWSINVVIESLVPTIIMLLAVFRTSPVAYIPLSSPAIPVYFLLIILSVLRLKPWLCWLMGLTSTLGYLAVWGVAWSYFPEHPMVEGNINHAIHATFAVMIFLGGLASAGVTSRIQQHVLAALQEFITRQENEQMKHNLDIARSIQQGLLPRRKPTLSGFDIAGWSLPAEQTGGDYYDWQELADDRLVVSLADVTGHGIGPALVTAVSRAYARASFLGPEELGRLVDRLHSLLADDLPSNRFVTFAAAMLTGQSDQLQLISAGHGPIFIYNSEKDRVESRNADGMPLGVMPETPYAPANIINLNSGDVLILLTDGFFEWANARGEQYGTDRLSERIRSVINLPAEEMIRVIYDDVLAFAAGTPQEDDLTAVIVKRL